ncbi:MAG: hypothetical protein HC927_05005 [Deltaproteobacteria bacterium]|nr:hypothetical protein [Deltaproteobacteria bacterium]
MVVLGDIHTPVHDESAVTMALEVIKHVKPKYVVQIGDLGEFASISDHKRLRGQSRNFAEELYGAYDMAERIRQTAVDANPEAQCWLTEGNHDARVEKLVGTDLPEFVDLHELDLLHQLTRRGWSCVPWNVPLHVNDNLILIHEGAATLTSSNVKALGRSKIYGHTHRAGVVYAGQEFGTLHLGMMVGYLGDKHKMVVRGYKALPDYIHGVGLVSFGPEGLFQASFVPFVRKKTDGALWACIDGYHCEVR